MTRHFQSDWLFRWSLHGNTAIAHTQWYFDCFYLNVFTADLVNGSATWIGRGFSCVCVQKRDGDARISFELTPFQVAVFFINPWTLLNGAVAYEQFIFIHPYFMVTGRMLEQVAEKDRGLLWWPKNWPPGEIANKSMAWCYEIILSILDILYSSMPQWIRI